MQHFTLDLRLFVNILSVMVETGYWQSEGTLVNTIFYFRLKSFRKLTTQ